MSDQRSLVDPVDDRVLRLTAVVSVGPARAFAYFTRPELLTQWLAAVAEVSSEVGGAYEVFWAPDDRQHDSTIGCRITALTPGELVAFQWRGPRAFKDLTNGDDPLTHVVVSFVPHGTGTRVHLLHSGWRSGPAWAEAYAWQERAWTGALAKLERIASS